MSNQISYRNFIFCEIILSEIAFPKRLRQNFFIHTIYAGLMTDFMVKE